MSAFDEIMKAREEGGDNPFEMNRATLGQDLGQPEQEPSSNRNSGVGAIIGSLVGTGAAALPVVPKHPAIVETLIGGFTALGDAGESLVRRGKIDPESAGIEAGASMAGGFAVRGVVGGFRRGSRYFTESVTPEARDAINFLRQYRPTSQFMTAAEMTENRMLDLSQNFAEHALWGGGDIRKFRLHSNDVVNEISKDIADYIGTKKDNIHIGRMIKNIRDHASDINKIPISNQYKVIEEEAKRLQLNVTLHGLKAWARPFAEENKAIGRVGQDLTGKGLAEKIMKFNDDMNVGDLMAFQRAIRAKIRNLEKSIDKSEAPAIGFYREANKEVDKMVEKGLRQTGAPPDLYFLKRDADVKWKDVKSQFSNDVIKGLMKHLTKDPTSVHKHILAGEGAEQLITSLNRIMPPEARKVYQRGALETLYHSAWDSGRKHLRGSDLLNMLTGPQGLGERAGKALWGKEGWNTIHHFAKSLAEIQKKTPVTEGSLAVQFTQFGALLALASGRSDVQTGGAAVLLGPKVLAKILTNPKVEQALLRGSTMTKSDPRWSATLARITSAASVAQSRKEQDRQPTDLNDLLDMDLGVNQLQLGFQ